MNIDLLLPNNFRIKDVLDFHRRDSEAIAESVGNHTITKGLIWHGTPACLKLEFEQSSVHVELELDDAEVDCDLVMLKNFVIRMLGLTQNVEEFERLYPNHSVLGAMIKQHSGLRIPVSATPFEALTWAITGQQISVRAAIALRRRLILCAGITHSSGLHCYPDAEQLVKLSKNNLRQVGFSDAKAGTILKVCHLVVEQELDLNLLAVDRYSMKD